MTEFFNRHSDKIKEIISQRGDHRGIVHIFSAMETCTAYKPWHDKKSHKTFFKYDSGRCLHYYFYFIDNDFGLCYLRVPTWAPFRLQFYCNAHNWVARQLNKKRIGFNQIENAFVEIDDFKKAQKLADSFPVNKLHKMIDKYTRDFCPALRYFAAGIHWSVMIFLFLNTTEKWNIEMGPAVIKLQICERLYLAFRS